MVFITFMDDTAFPEIVFVVYRIKKQKTSAYINTAMKKEGHTRKLRLQLTKYFKCMHSLTSKISNQLKEYQIT